MLYTNNAYALMLLGLLKVIFWVLSDILHSL